MRPIEKWKQNDCLQSIRIQKSKQNTFTFIDVITHWMSLPWGDSFLPISEQKRRTSYQASMFFICFRLPRISFVMLNKGFLFLNFFAFILFECVVCICHLKLDSETQLFIDIFIIWLKKRLFNRDPLFSTLIDSADSFPFITMAKVCSSAPPFLPHTQNWHTICSDFHSIWFIILHNSTNESVIFSLLDDIASLEKWYDFCRLGYCCCCCCCSRMCTDCLMCIVEFNLLMVLCVFSLASIKSILRAFVPYIKIYSICLSFALKWDENVLLFRKLFNTSSGEAWKETLATDDMHHIGIFQSNFVLCNRWRLLFSAQTPAFSDKFDCLHTVFRWITVRSAIFTSLPTSPFFCHFIFYT